MNVEPVLLALQAAFLVLARVYFFSIPFAGISIATALYVGGLIVARAG